MPPERIPLAHTIEFKIRIVDEFRASGASQVQFVHTKAAGSKKSFSRSTLQYWLATYDSMKAAAAERKRAKALTVGGSGRISLSAPIEDALCVWLKDQRREEHPVSMQCIVAQCVVLLPEFLEGKTDAACMAWCSRFMRRNGLTIRKISHSGRKKHPELLVLKEMFAAEVTKLLCDYFLDSEAATPPPYALFNMDQTAVYCDVGEKTTVDFVGVTRVAADGGGEGSYRCSAALLVCADGRMLPPHFVFKGEGNGQVYDEVQSFCEPGVATFSVQEKAWFSERVMHEWIDMVWQYEVSGPTVLILDCLKIHKCESVRERLARMGTFPVYVPPGGTSVAQPLDVGVMAPFKRSLRARYTELYRGRRPPRTARERRYDMYCRSMHALKTITADTIKNSFIKAGPFIPYGPSLN